MRKSVELVVLLLLVMGNCKLAGAESSRGTLAVTAQVQTSAMWVQQADGKWSLIVANAADPATMFTAGDRGKESHRGQSRASAARAAKNASKTQHSVSQGGS